MKEAAQHLDQLASELAEHDDQVNATVAAVARLIEHEQAASLTARVPADTLERKAPYDS